MRTRRLSLAAAFTAAAFLATTGAAVPAGAPTQLRLHEDPAQLGTTSRVDTDLSIGGGAPPTAQVSWYVPRGYGVDLTLAPGTKLGSGLIGFAAGTSATSGAGSLTADDPAAHQADTCAPGLHAAVWLLTAPLDGQPFVLPLYVDPAPSAVATRASLRVQACFDPPATSGRTFSALDLAFTRGITNPVAPGSYVWRALVTPFGPAGLPNGNGTIEAQALVPLPHEVTIRTRYDAKQKRLAVSGAATAGRGREAGVPISISTTTDLNLGRQKRIGLVRTDAHGAFRFTHAFTKTAYVIVQVPDSAYGADCEDPISPSPCTFETIAASDPAIRKVLVPAPG